MELYRYNFVKPLGLNSCKSRRIYITKYWRSEKTLTLLKSKFWNFVQCHINPVLKIQYLNRYSEHLEGFFNVGRHSSWYDNFYVYRRPRIYLYTYKYIIKNKEKAFFHTLNEIFHFLRRRVISRIQFLQVDIRIYSHSFPSIFYWRTYASKIQFPSQIYLFFLTSETSAS